MAEISTVLPEDVFITEKLLRLPVKSTGRCRCVSKPWRCLLTNPEFIKTHINLYLHDPPENIIFTNCHYAVESCSINGGNNSVSRQLTTPLTKPIVFLEGSCHGLVLLRRGRDSHDRFINARFLVNPITLEAEVVPISGLASGDPVTCALGYNSLDDDYKVVLVSPELRSRNLFVDIYSVKAKTWKRSAVDLEGISVLGWSGSMSVNSCIHWLAAMAFESKEDIYAFSLAREEFVKLETPIVGKCCSTTDLSVLGGFLAFAVKYSSDDYTEVWTMKEYGVYDSWTMKFIITSPPGLGRFARSIVCCLGDDEILVANEVKQLSAYNWRNGVWRDMPIAGFPFTAVRAFTGSLFFPSKLFR